MAINQLYPYWLNGKLDDIAIYNRALTAQEVSQMYTASAPCIANITNNTGATVHAVALSNANHSTCGDTSAADIGLSMANCNRQHRQATLDAKPTKRKAPTRLTICPLNIR